MKIEWLSGAIIAISSAEVKEAFEYLGWTPEAVKANCGYRENSAEPAGFYAEIEGPHFNREVPQWLNEILDEADGCERCLNRFLLKASKNGLFVPPGVPIYVEGIASREALINVLLDAGLTSEHIRFS